jgi:hypothetical protein
MRPSLFSSELADLPAPIAEELEDHLMESFEAGLRSGMSADEARKSALRSLGAPKEITRRCLRGADPREPHRIPNTPLQRVAIVGWLLLGIAFASRVCAAPDPSHGSIAACVSLSVGSLAMALLLRRGWLSLRVAVALSLGLTLAAVIPWLQVTWHPWIHDRLALTPAALGYLALFGALSVGSFTAAPRRTA